MERDTTKFIDLVIFYIGLSAYARMEGIEENDPHLQGGLGFGLRVLDEMRGGFKDLVEPYTKTGMPEGKLSVGTHLKKVLAKRRNQKAVINSGMSAQAIMVKMGRKTPIRDAIFDGRSNDSARKLITAVASEDSPGPLLKKLAAIPSVSAFKKGRKWIEQAAGLAGHPLSDVESVQMDTADATDVAEVVNQTVADIEGTDPVSPQSAALQDQKRAGLDKIQDIADSSKSPDAVVGAAAAVLNSGQVATAYKYKTETGRETGHDPDQEIAMMVRGPSVIAAGAGSGKTRTLASKVVYHKKELGLSEHQIIACSFTKASAAELMRRINEYGGDIDFNSRAIRGFGTTHSISGKLLSHYGGQKKRKDLFNDQYLLMELAKRQVKMRPTTTTDPVDENESFFDFSAVDPTVGREGRIKDLDTALKTVYEFFLYEKENSDFWRGRWQQQKIQGWLDFLISLKDKDPMDLTEEERDELNRLMGHPTPEKPKGQWYWRRNMQEHGMGGYKVGAGDDMLADPVESADDGDVDSSDEALIRHNAKKEKKRKSIEERLQKKYPYFYSNPANQWFNLGLSEEDFERPHPYLKDAKESIPNGEFARYQSKIKGDARAPGEAWKMARENDEESRGEATQDRWELMPAVYGAYEWLMKNEATARDKTTFDEMLLDVVKMLVANPDTLQKVQRDFKLILVDEAQDLNRTSHLAFGLIAGYLDPATLEPYPREADGKPKINADTYTFIGDGKQCVASNSVISMPGVSKHASDVKVGDEVHSYRNGKIVPQKVRHVAKSSWDWGYQVILENGQHITMSPNHKIWAGKIITEGDQHIVYLMWRKDMGFRVGVTNKGKTPDGKNHFGGRTCLEKADKLWVLDVCPDREEALTKELQYSLRYSIPTTVFNGKYRGQNEDRINTIFEEFGRNGAKLLEAKHLNFDLPNWMAQSYSQTGNSRLTVNMIAHSASSTQVAVEWEGQHLDEKLEGVRYKKLANGRNRLRRWFANYREALDHARDIAGRTGAMLSRRLSTPEGPMRLVTASVVKPGMTVAVRTTVVNGEDNNSGIVLAKDSDVVTQTITQAKVVEVRKVGGFEFIDLDVEDASNFFANGILSHNSIYGFRGSNVELFEKQSDIYPGENGGFTTRLLEKNYRSGSNIVDASQNLSEHMDTIPMACHAWEQKGEGEIYEDVIKGMEPAHVPDYIAAMIDADISGDDPQFKAGDFGFAARTNKQATAMAMACLRRGIPFKTKKSIFGKKSNIANVIKLVVFAKKGGESLTLSNAAVIECTNTPVFMISGNTLKRKFRDAGVSDYYTFLVGGGWSQLYSGEWADNLRQYTEYLQKLRGMSGGTPQEILDFILNYPGATKFNIVEGLVEKIEANDDEYSKYLSELDSGEKPSEESLQTYAAKPFDVLYEVAQNYDDLDGFAGYLKNLLPDINKIMETEDPKDSEIAKKKKLNAVRIDTVHGWKGLECKQLFVPMWQGNFPHQMITDEEEMKQERRLAYVAMTRGEDSVKVIRPEFTGRMDRDGKPIPTQPSQFVGEACVRSLDSLIAEQAGRQASIYPAGFSFTVAARNLIKAAKEGKIALYPHFSEDEELRGKWGDLMVSPETSVPSIRKVDE